MNSMKRKDFECFLLCCINPSTYNSFWYTELKKKTHVNELITESVNQSLLKEKNKLELNGSLKNSFKDSMIQ